MKNTFFCKLAVVLLAVFAASTVSAETKIRITGTVEWDTLQIKAQVSLDLVSAGIRLPSGRTQAELLLGAGYSMLIQPGIFELQVDSSSTIGDLVNSGEFSLLQTEALAQGAKSVPPYLSPDFNSLFASYTMQLSSFSAALIRHNSPSPVIRTLNPVSSAQYTGIIIIASESLPVHGKRSSALPVPCLFPKIWDSDMNLIYERNMLQTRSTTMVRYAPLQSIFQNNPSGLTPELTAVVGERPLRIFAEGVFGINPTDLIIDRSDALLIISSEANRRLLTEGRVAIILDDSVLRQEFSAEQN